MTDIQPFEIEISNNCPICLDNYTGQSIWTCKQCKQRFHKNCIQNWKTINPHYPTSYTCPVCKLQYKICHFKINPYYILYCNLVIVLIILPLCLLLADGLFILYFLVWI